MPIMEPTQETSKYSKGNASSTEEDLVQGSATSRSDLNTSSHKNHFDPPAGQSLNISNQAVERQRLGPQKAPHKDDVSFEGSREANVPEDSSSTICPQPSWKGKEVDEKLLRSSESRYNHSVTVQPNPSVQRTAKGSLKRELSLSPPLSCRTPLPPPMESGGEKSLGSMPFTPRPAGTSASHATNPAPNIKNDQKRARFDSNTGFITLSNAQLDILKGRFHQVQQFNGRLRTHITGLLQEIEELRSKYVSFAEELKRLLNDPNSLSSPSGFSVSERPENDNDDDREVSTMLDLYLENHKFRQMFVEEHKIATALQNRHQQCERQWANEKLMMQRQLEILKRQYANLIAGQSRQSGPPTDHATTYNKS